MIAQRVLAVGPNGGARFYSSASAASRALSGYGVDSLRNTIMRRVDEGGGYVGNVFVIGTTVSSIKRPV